MYRKYQYETYVECMEDGMRREVEHLANGEHYADTHKRICSECGREMDDE